MICLETRENQQLLWGPVKWSLQNQQACTHSPQIPKETKREEESRHCICVFNILLFEPQKPSPLARWEQAKLCCCCDSWFLQQAEHLANCCSLSQPTLTNSWRTQVSRRQNSNFCPFAHQPWRQTQRHCTGITSCLSTKRSPSGFTNTLFLKHI